MFLQFWLDKKQTDLCSLGGTEKIFQIQWHSLGEKKDNFSLKKFYFIEYGWFTMFCLFLIYSKVTQLYF